MYKQLVSRFPDTKLGGNTVCLCLYQQYFKNSDTAHCNLDQLRRLLGYIVSYDEDHASPYSRAWPAMKITLKAVAEQLKTGVPRAELQVLDLVDPHTLSDTEATMERDGEITAYASPREAWYAEKTRALISSGQWAACVDDAMTSAGKLHNNNHIWYRKRKAQALQRLGRKEEARELLL